MTLGILRDAEAWRPQKKEPESPDFLQEREKKMSQSPPCSNILHTRGTATRVVRETPRTIFAERICPACGRSQGIARIRKSEQH